MHDFYNMMVELNVVSVFRAGVLLAVGYFLSRFISESLDRTLRKRLTVHHVTLLKRIAFYALFLLFFASAIQQLGFRINALLGATGILTVALGIASQTSMSNLISGLFIIGEKPFEIGNTIQVNNIKGEVLSIDFMSVKIRTNDNVMVRIPNETLVKSAITNVSYFPLRRIDLIIGVSYKESIPRVQSILLAVAKNNENCRDEPMATVLVDSLGDCGVNLLFSSWVKREEYQYTKSTLQAEVKAALEAQGVEMSSNSFISTMKEPFPIKIISSDK